MTGVVAFDTYAVDSVKLCSISMKTHANKYI